MMWPTLGSRTAKEQEQASIDGFTGNLSMYLLVDMLLFCYITNKFFFFFYSITDGSRADPGSWQAACR